MNPAELYVRACKTLTRPIIRRTESNQVPLKGKGRLINRNTTENDNWQYIIKKYGIDQQQVNIFSKISTTSLFILITIHHLIIDNPIHQYLFAIGALIILHYLTLSYLPSAVKREGLIQEQLIDIINLDIDLLLVTTPPSQDMTLKMLKMLLPYDQALLGTISETYRLAQCGKAPESSVKQHFYPSKRMREYINNLFSRNNNQKNQATWNQDSNAEEAFIEFSKSLESRISITFFVGLFFPIGVAFLTLLGFMSEIQLVLSVPLLMLILSRIQSHFLKSKITLVGSFNDGDTTDDEYLTILRMIEEFAHYLEKFPPEYAIYAALRDRSNSIEALFGIRGSNLIPIGTPFSECIKIMLGYVNGRRTRLLLQNVNSSIELDSFQTSGRIVKLLDVIRKNIKIQNERKQIIKAEQFKAIVFIFLLPMILGVLSGLFPTFISLMGVNEGFGEFGYPLIVLRDSIVTYFIIVQTLYIIMVTHTFTRVIKIKHGNALLLFSLLEYAGVILVTTSLNTISLFSNNLF
jgi:hypothetical protein